MSVAGLVARFTVAGLVVMNALAGVIAVLARQAGTEKAIESAEQVSWVTAHGIVEPRLTPAVLAGDPEALTAFDTAMRNYVLKGLWSGSSCGRRTAASSTPTSLG